MYRGPGLRDEAGVRIYDDVGPPAVSDSPSGKSESTVKGFRGSYREPSPRRSHPSPRSLSHVDRALLAAILADISSGESSSMCL